MRLFILAAALLSLVLTLAACACPVPEVSYHKPPYDEDRTAGHGYVEDGCARMSLPGY